MVKRKKRLRLKLLRMSDHISNQPTVIESYTQYIQDCLNDFVEEFSDKNIIVDSIGETDRPEYQVRVTFKFKKTVDYDGWKAGSSQENYTEHKEEDLCIVLEGNKYLHIFSRTEDWSSFDEDRLFELCLDLIMSSKNSGKN